MKVDYDEVTIIDWGNPEYLDGVTMQFVVRVDDYTMAFCDTLDIARLLANAMTSTGGSVIIKQEG